jgi:TonB-dependent starch-binding outer membrane protein SusC
MKRAFTKWTFLLVIMFLTTASIYGQRTISGTVTDAESGESLVGANVLVKGFEGIGTSTDFDGNYSIEVPQGATALIFSFIGYTEKEVELSVSNILNVGLQSGTQLDELVVIGYGSVRKSDLTGSVSTVREEDFNVGILPSPDQLIQGKVAGVQVINNSGAPGAGTTVRIRGNSSIRAGNQPLYVVDGVPLDGRSARPGLNSGDLGSTPDANPLNFINPADIESMEVLKDASATAIYGSRGANGVIIINTKRGKTGEPKIDFSTSVGASNILKKYDVLDGNQYRSALEQYDLRDDDGNLLGNEGGNVDAMDAILRTGITQNYNFSISGGNSNGNYRLSAGYMDQEGIIIGSNFKKYTASLNGSYKFLKSKRLGVDFNLMTAHTDEQLAPITSNAGFQGSLIGQALQWNPTISLMDANDPTGFRIDRGSTTVNPLAMANAYNDNANVTTILGSISPSFKISDNLEYRMIYSLNSSLGNRRSSVQPWINIQGIQDRGLANLASNQLITQQFTHTLNYNRKLGREVNFNAVLGYEYMSFANRGFGLTAQDFIFTDIDMTDALNQIERAGSTIFSFRDPLIELQSYFARTNFNIRNKYLITATVRADGSSKFGENNKYGIFPSLAAAWNIQEEEFFASNFIDQLKFRAGWGQVGNQEFPAGAAQERFAFSPGGVSLVNVANPNLQWESQSTINLGLDFAFNNYKWFGSIEVFRQVTTNLLFNFEAIQPAPATRFFDNLDGEIINTGLEIDLNYMLAENSRFRWSIGGNIAFLKNELQNYFGPTVETGALFGQGLTGALSQRLENGQPLNSFYLREHLGIGENGQSILTDDGDSFFHLGQPNPTVLLGVTSNMSYDDFTFGFSFNGAMGHQIYNNTANSVLPIGNLGTRNIDANLIGGPVQEARSNAIRASSRYLESGNFVRLANLSLGYNFGSIGEDIKNVRLSLIGQNLLLFTNYTGFDPEVNTVNVSADGVPSFGIEYIPFPSARTVMLGLNFSF